jgi:glycine/D-amino acid oxidase-like deaminating enzyme
METVDVAIIGAGVHGASVAFHLGVVGTSVALFDSRGPAGGPTGRSSAICRAYYTNAHLAAIARKSIEMFAHFDDITHGPSGFRQTGFLWMHGKDDEVELDSSVRQLGEAGVTVQRLRHHDVESEYPQFSSDGVTSALWEPGAGYADPVLTTTSLVNRAVELGALTFFYSTVTSIERAAGEFVVKTDRGDTVHADKVLLAAGPWTGQLALSFGVELPLTVERHVVAVIRWPGATAMRFGHADLISGQYYCKPEADDMFCVGPLLAGEAANPDSYDVNLETEEGFALSRAVALRAPVLRDAVLTGGWASLYDVSPDWQPVIGEIAEGLFIDAGTSGHGFKLAPALGREVADLILGQPDPALAQFHPRRFKAGELLSAGYGGARILG